MTIWDLKKYLFLTPRQRPTEDENFCFRFTWQVGNTEFLVDVLSYKPASDLETQTALFPFNTRFSSVFNPLCIQWPLFLQQEVQLRKTGLWLWMWLTTFLAHGKPHVKLCWLSFKAEVAHSWNTATQRRLMQ